MMMKIEKLPYVLVFLLVSNVILAQSLKIVLADTIVEGNASTSNDLSAYIGVMNISSADKNFKVKRIDRNYNSLTDSNAICWGVCYQTSVSVSPTAIEIKSGDFNKDFTGHVYPNMNGVSSSGPITYVFFDSENPRDSIAFTITYKVTPDFSTKENEKTSLVSVYPNPVHHWLTVSYGGNIKNCSFEIKNIIGKQVLTEQLADYSAEYHIDVSSLIPGVYFYEFKENGKSIRTRKLIIE